VRKIAAAPPAPQGSHRQRTLDRLRQEELIRRAVEFFKPQSRRTYLEIYHRIDLGLDSFPTTATPPASILSGWAYRW